MLLMASQGGSVVLWSCWPGVQRIWALVLVLPCSPGPLNHPLQDLYSWDGSFYMSTQRAFLDEINSSIGELWGKPIVVHNVCGLHQSVEDLNRRKRLTSLSKKEFSAFTLHLHRQLLWVPHCSYGLASLHICQGQFLIISLFLCVCVSLFVSLSFSLSPPSLSCLPLYLRLSLYMYIYLYLPI